MCVPGCQEVVTQRLSRRNLFRGAAGMAAVAAFSSTPVAGAFAAPVSFTRVVDLTHVLDPAFPTFFGKPQLEVRKLFTFDKDGFNLNEWVVNEHTGTHLDTPFHFSKDGLSADALAIETLVVPLAVVDVSAKAAANPDYQLVAADLDAWEAANGPLPAGVALALYSGWEKKLGTDGFRNADAAGVLHFPGFHPDLAAVLARKGASGVVVDTLSLDHGASKDFAFHYKWLGSGRWGVEAAANLGALPPKGATLVVGGPKIKGASGGPSRVLALV
ncbi:cyclase family protein [Starkeya koreensis]|uniref:Cyclase family protein n=1 Tax=Ancylobacter koreensis TaxID=266121 RepID=A0ABT0DNG6_9HYPH|nr:cyclase family protein [Ancylobacter koreensis]MCK0208759.1 cyclase family protein [Ancylobacter koreensis]